METTGLDIKSLPDGVSLKVRVQPRASRNMIAGLFGDCLKIHLSTPPVDGAANQACIEFIAAVFDVPRSRVTISSGHKNRIKNIKIMGIDKASLIDKLETL
ncbi:DUF167 domain-containing protein [Dendrosporobacter sp. 1207_IL3150]|uniref:DUF167 domain-containing protein n=1 Tax=Dendrosporobacter sp. 1207_IL3150 TaxID=3084054 RepID=UPI002FDAA9BB